MNVSARRLYLGRLAVYLEPRDAWIGAYIADGAVYVCPLPFLVIRWNRLRGPLRPQAIQSNHRTPFDLQRPLRRAVDPMESQ